MTKFEGFDWLMEKWQGADWKKRVTGGSQTGILRFGSRRLFFLSLYINLGIGIDYHNEY